MTDDQLIPLRRAAEIFLGDSKHVATLRAEAARGNLVVSKIGRGYWTTLDRLKAMDEKCQGDHLARNCGSTRSEKPGPLQTVEAANFDLYRRRQELIAKRNATDDPVKREQIGILIEQLTTFDRATGMQRLALAPAIERQMNLINQRS